MNRLVTVLFTKRCSLESCGIKVGQGPGVFWCGRTACRNQRVPRAWWTAVGRLARGRG